MSKFSPEILKTLRREIKRHDKAENRINYQQFFKETLTDPVGLKTPVLRKISNQTFKQVRSLPKNEILAGCDILLASGERYMRFFAFEWALKIKNQHTPRDFARFESWLKKYVDNWGSCDHLCGGPLGYLIYRFPELVTKPRRWIRSRNRWLRRAAAVSLIVPVRKRQLLEEVFRTAEALLVDQDDMVQKGYGWMLKEASNVFPDEVFKFVMENKDQMPRTALRYAIEKLPNAKKKQAMRRGR